jgi:hypothetical protein
LETRKCREEPNSQKKECNNAQLTENSWSIFIWSSLAENIDENKAAERQAIEQRVHEIVEIEVIHRRGRRMEPHNVNNDDSL